MFKPTDKQNDMIWKYWKEYKELCKDYRLEPMNFYDFIENLLTRGFNNIKGIITKDNEPQKNIKDNQFHDIKTTYKYFSNEN